jgi:hypothetical protein
MANKYFIAGVGRALLFKGETLFADCRTLADSSITIGVTAEDIRGGEGNKLWGQYFHDSSFSMKLTDIMFNLEYVAANVGADIAHGGDVFKTETVKAEAGVLTLAKAPVPVVTNGEAKVFYRKAAEADAEMMAIVAEGNKVTVGGAEDNADYCVLYRYTDDAAQVVTVNAQFIPETLHAVLTVALYSGDSCNVEASTKVGEIEIDIPRFQLTGAMDISMTATGASQTPLEGNALASGCAGCSGDGIYATITKVLFNAKWYDGVEGLIIEDNYVEIAAGDYSRQLVVYAYYRDGAPKQIDASKLEFVITPDIGLAVSPAGFISGTAGNGTATITVAAQEMPELKASATIVCA